MSHHNICIDCGKRIKGYAHECSVAWNAKIGAYVKTNRKMCKQPDRDAPGLTCGYPLPCPHHSVVVVVK